MIDLRKEGIRTKTAMVPVAKIDHDFFVRTRINEDHAMYLAMLLEGSEKEADAERRVVLPPVLLIPTYTVDSKFRLSFAQASDTYKVVYGRHRLHAEDVVLDHLEVKAEIIVSGVETESQLISLAYRENTGGSLPPTQKDSEHTVEMLLDRNVPKKDIAQLLCVPTSLAMKFIRNVEIRLDQAKVSRAHHHVAFDGMTVPQAAEKEGVTVAKVQDRIIAGNKKRKQGEIEEMSREIGHSYRSTSSKLSNSLRILFTKYDEGEIDAKTVFNILKQIESAQKKAVKTAADWRARFEAKLVSNGKAKVIAK